MQEYEDNDDYDAEDDDMEATGENMKTDLKFQPHLVNIHAWAEGHLINIYNN